MIPALVGITSRFHATAAPLTLNPVNYASGGLTLSNGNRTILRNTLRAGSYDVAFGSKSRTAGKLYYELVIDFTNTTNSPVAVGLALTSAPLSWSSGVAGTPAAGMVWSASGTGSVYTGGAVMATPLPLAVTGDVVCVAADLALQLAWWRINGGAWNSLLAGTQDPASGQGGIALPVSAGWGVGAAVWPYEAIRRNNGTGGQTTLNGTVAQFAQAVPAGFSPW